MESNRRNYVAVFTAIVVSGIAATPLISNLANAQSPSSIFPFSDICSHKVLFDNAAGNAKGWNPNGILRTFTISDSCVNPLNSVVLVNTKQSNFVICAVDYLVSGAFEVNCNLAPSNNGELHYDVFNHFTTSILSEPGTLAPDVASAAGARVASNSSTAAPLSAEQLGSSPASNQSSSNTTSTP
jgi:hypothetical protein